MAEVVPGPYYAEVTIRALMQNAFEANSRDSLGELLQQNGYGELQAEDAGEALLHFADGADFEQAEALSSVVTSYHGRLHGLDRDGVDPHELISLPLPTLDNGEPLEDPDLTVDGFDSSPVDFSGDTLDSYDHDDVDDDLPDVDDLEFTTETTATDAHYGDLELPSSFGSYTVKAPDVELEDTDVSQDDWLSFEPPVETPTVDTVDVSQTPDLEFDAVANVDIDDDDLFDLE